MATRRNIAAPNLVVAPKQYEQRYQEQLNNVLRLFFNTVVNENNSPYSYGSFCSSLQTVNPGYPNSYPIDPKSGYLSNPVPEAMNLVPFSVTAESFNTKIGAIPSRIYVSETGLYNVQFSAQCNLSSGSTGVFYFWIRKNGVNVDNTSGKIVVNGSNAETMAAWNYVLTLVEGDYIELAWSSSDTHAYLEVETGNSIRPAVPAVILTVAWVTSVNLSAGLS